jgi:hypothetical protein
MARETALWDWLSKARQQYDSLHMERVENMIADGTPDVEGCIAGINFQIELKTHERPRRSKTPIRFPVRRAQIEWHQHRWEAGGNSCWLLQVGSSADRRIYLLAGPFGQMLLDGMPESRLDFYRLNNWTHGPRLKQKDILRIAATCRNRLNLGNWKLPSF